MPELTKPDISTFFPVYNEEGNIPKLYEDATKTLKKVANKYEILFILFEGSTDGSRGVIENLVKKDEHIRLVIQPLDKKGVGYAYNLGYSSAIYPIIFYADGDNQFEFEEIEKFLKYINDHEIVAGYRVNRKDPIIRKITSKVYNLLVRIVFGKLARDVDCASRMVQKKIFEKVQLHFFTGLGTTELLAKAKFNGFKIKEVGVKHLPRYAGESVFEGRFNMVKPNVVITQVRDLFKLRKELKNKRR